MASQTDIYNGALGLLGAKTIVSPSDQSVNARACNNCYDRLRRAEYRKHPWNFATQRFQVAASATTPAFGYDNAYPLPAGWMRVLPPDPIQNFNDRDWIIEGGMLLTDWGSPLNLRCVMDITDTTLMDPLFIEALAARMAWEMCEALTQSNTKKADVSNAYKEAILEARKANAIEKVPQSSVEDTWITARINGSGPAGACGWGPW